VSSVAEQGRYPGKDFIERGGGNGSDEFDLTDLPIETFHVISQDHACHAAVGGDRHFEGISLLMTGDRADDRETRLSIVVLWGEHQCGATSCLLATCLWVKGQPDQITGSRNVRGHLQRFLTLWRTPVGFGVEIAGLDAREEFVQRVFAASGTQHDAAIGGDIERHPIALGEAGVFNDGLGNSDGEAVSPLRYLSFTCHMDLH
jgi:hypothetical protein